MYQDFKRRQGEVEHLYWLTNRRIREDIHLLREPEERYYVLEEMTSLIIPKGSYVDRFLSLFKVPSITSYRRSSKSSRYLQKIAFFLPPKFRAVVTSFLKYQPIIQVAYNVAKPVLISAGISVVRNVVRGVLRRVFR